MRGYARDNGLFTDWEESGLLSSYGTNLTEYCTNALEYGRDFCGNGKIYGILTPIVTYDTDSSPCLYTWDLRYDYYLEQGCPEIENLEDYEQCVEWSENEAKTRYASEIK